MFAKDGKHRRMLAAILAVAAPVFAMGACNDDPLFEVPVEPPAAPTAVNASADGSDVTVTWTPGVGATSQQVTLSPVVAVPLSFGNALQADDIVQLINDNTTNTWTFTDVPDGTYQASVTAINSGGQTTSGLDEVVVGGGSGTTPTVTVEAAEGGLLLTWTAIDNAENYHVIIMDGTTTVEDDVAPASATQWLFASPVSGVTYTSQVCAVLPGPVEDCSDTVDFTYVANTAPTAEITAPADASEFFDTELITLTGTGTDAEDGALTGESLVWSSDVDGDLGTGEELVADASTVTLGAHTITLTATDADGATGEASIGITINEATSVQSFSVTFGPYFADNCTACHGGATPTVGVGLDSWEGVVRSVSTSGAGGGPTIVIGDATMGVLVPKLRAAHNDGPDDDAVANGLEAWIDDGAPNN